MVSIELLAMVVLGGLGNLLGSVLGAGIITYLPELLRTSAPAIAEHRMVFYGALLVIVMILRPNGLLGTSSEHGWLSLAGTAASRRQTGGRGQIGGGRRWTSWRFLTCWVIHAVRRPAGR